MKFSLSNTATAGRAPVFFASLLLALQACGQSGAPAEVQAQTQDQAEANAQAASAGAGVTSIDRSVPADIEKAIREALGGIDEGLEVGTVEASEIPGLYAVKFDPGPMVYTTADGAYFVLGDLYSVQPDGFTNLGEQRRDVERMAQVNAIEEDEMIVFPAKGETLATITVFTDITCFYCQKLHQEVPALNEAGVAVRYLAYPRQGVDSDGYRLLVTAWCADNQQDTLTRLKAKESLASVSCDENPVENQYALGQQLGVRGTPAIILDSGKLVPGYQSAPDMLVTLGLTE
ncbi:MAG: thioredoxin fold domain-containing protein [Pseudomonadota bacterium]